MSSKWKWKIGKKQDDKENGRYPPKIRKKIMKKKKWKLLKEKERFEI